MGMSTLPSHRCQSSGSLSRFRNKPTAETASGRPRRRPVDSDDRAGPSRSQSRRAHLGRTPSRCTAQDSPRSRLAPPKAGRPVVVRPRVCARPSHRQRPPPRPAPPPPPSSISCKSALAARPARRSPAVRRPPSRPATPARSTAPADAAADRTAATAANAAGLDVPSPQATRGRALRREPSCDGRTSIPPKAPQVNVYELVRVGVA